MDIATIIGLVLGVFFVILGIITGPDGVASFENFWDLVSVFITMGGSISEILTSNTIQTFVNGLKGFTLAIKGVKFDEADIIRNIINLSHVAR